MSAKSALRVLLRAVDRNVTSVAGNQQWRQHILQQFRANAGLQDATQQQQMVLLAQEYADLISNVAHHQELLLSYNLGVDAEERNKQMVAKTAARVGFALPDAAQQQQPAAASEPQQQQDVQQQAAGASGRHADQQLNGAGGVRHAVAAAAYGGGLEAAGYPQQVGSMESR